MEARQILNSKRPMSTSSDNTTATSTTSAAHLGMRQPVRAPERLQRIYEHEGPYTTVYLATSPLSADTTVYLPPDPLTADTSRNLQRRWAPLRVDLVAQSAPTMALEAIDARLGLPGPEDTAAIAIIAAADGATIVEYGQEPLRADVAVVDALPYAGPLLEWDQGLVPHLVVIVDDSGADIVVFGTDHSTRLDSHEGTWAELSGVVVDTIQAAKSELVVVAGSPSIVGPLAAHLTTSVPIECRVVAEADPTTTDEIADATVRHLCDTTARATVGYLRELRFLAAHGEAVDGTADTIVALRSDGADVLLIHDDPADQRRIWTGPDPHQLSLESRLDHPTNARLIDAAIRAAISTDTIVHIIPTTGVCGPDDNTAVLRRTAGV
jgi:hypothetical protein